MNKMSKLLVDFSKDVHRFSITKDTFGYEVWGTVNGVSYIMHIDKFGEFIDSDFNQDEKGLTLEMETYIFIGDRLDEKVFSGVYKNESPIQIHN